ncbi:hypothetical protein Daus18300_003686 [Diaporthe australafricana]|uniref:FAD-binding PCMH-type domain-containing protein n=1 Tax=Diaporthe australafricana TaxID=127596 RepID=A0ABR3XEE0_9PEZI
MFANNSCNPIYPNGTSISGDPDAGEKGCQIGFYPPYSVNATEPVHVQEALKFIKQYNLRSNIKNTGHNGAKSSSYGALSIWTHNLQSFQFHQSFTPKSCGLNGTGANITYMGATVGAGMQDQTLSDALANHNALAVSGTNYDVGVAGWSTSGGHGLATAEYGMGADNIIEAAIVTPTGDLITANECQNSDIFWAIRGGNAGAFGVITSLTVKAYPMPDVRLWTFQVTQKNGTSIGNWYRFVAQVLSYMPDMHAGGFGGYLTTSAPAPGSQLGLVGTFFLFNKPNGTMERLNAELQDFFGSGNATDAAEVTSSTLYFQDLSSLLAMLPSSESVGKGGALQASRLLTRDSLTRDLDLVAEVLLEVGPNFDGPTDGISSPSVSMTMTGSSVPVDNALNPAWRETVLHFIHTRSWKDDVPQSIVESAFHNATYIAGAKLRQLAPNTGAYINEADINEPDWQSSLYGENYPRLFHIKQHIDPDQLLWCPHCPGSEAWVQHDDGKLCMAE